MALTYDQISAITRKKFIPKMVDNIFDSSPLLQRAKKRKWYESVDGGTQIIQPLNYAQNSSGGWYTGADTLDTTDNEVITAAAFDWKQSYDNISIKRLDELKNMGDSRVLDFVKAKMQIAEKTGMDRLGTGMYSDGSDSKAIGGLRLAVSASNTVGGISQSSYSWWQSQVDSTTTTLTISALQTQYNLCNINNEKPTLITTDATGYNTYYNLLQPQQRFADAETAKGGFSSLMFNGTVVLDDAKCPSGYMFFLNENYISLKYHAQENFRFEDFQKPVNQNVRVAKIYWAGNMTFSNLRMLGAFTALA